MIQRKQSLFLLVAVIVNALCLFLPVMGVTPQGMGVDTMVYNLGTVGGSNGGMFLSACTPLFCLCSLSAMIALGTIFMYKNRKAQMRMCSCGMFVSVLWYVYYALIYFGVVAVAGDGEAHFQFAACLPLVAIILIAMARKGVSDDEKLVRAADRIR